MGSRNFVFLFFLLLPVMAGADTLHVHWPPRDTVGLTIIEKVSELRTKMKDKSSITILEYGVNSGRPGLLKAHLLQRGLASGRISEVFVPSGEADRLDIVYSPVNPKYDVPVFAMSIQKPERDSLHSLIAAVQVGQTLALNNIRFLAGQAVVHPESVQELYNLYEVMRKNRSLKIKIEGHVCCLRETEGDFSGPGYRLSLARAKAIYDYLALEGIDSGRIAYEGFSGWRRLRPEVSPLDEAMNRRVEIRILAK